MYFIRTWCFPVGDSLQLMSVLLVISGNLCLILSFSFSLICLLWFTGLAHIPFHSLCLGSASGFSCWVSSPLSWLSRRFLFVWNTLFCWYRLFCLCISGSYELWPSLFALHLLRCDLILSLKFCIFHLVPSLLSCSEVCLKTFHLA